MDIRWVVAGLLAGIGAWLIALNVTLFWRIFISRKPAASSWIPGLGALFVAWGLLVIPVDGAKRLFWVPFVLDPGAAFGLLLALVVDFKKGRSSDRS